MFKSQQLLQSIHKRLAYLERKMNADSELNDAIQDHYYQMCAAINALYGQRLADEIQNKEYCKEMGWE